MPLLKHRLLGGVITGMFLSALVHAGTVGGLYYWFIKRDGPPIVADLDLSMLPMAPAAPNQGGGRSRPTEEWYVPPPHQKKKAPVPVPPPVVEEVPAPVVEEEPPLPCEEPCTESDGSGGGGSGQGQGMYVPAADTARKPRWVGNLIRPSDYPLLARQNGKDGRVVLQVFIDETGAVRDVRLMQGAYEPLNEVALRKVRAAKFTPAYDAQGDPVACQVTLPIRFELR